MKEIRFKIKGNQEDGTGNPVPYTRTTQRSYWNEKAKRYKEYKDYVVATFNDHIKKEHPEYLQKFQRNWINRGKPIELKKDAKVKVDTMIEWKNKNHGDPDNIWKGIVDTLFNEDKNIDGSFSSGVTGEGAVEVAIIYDNDPFL